MEYINTELEKIEKVLSEAGMCVEHTTFSKFSGKYGTADTIGGLQVFETEKSRYPVMINSNETENELIDRKSTSMFRNFITADNAVNELKKAFANSHNQNVDWV